MSNIKYRQFVNGKFHYWGYINQSENGKPEFTGPIKPLNGSFVDSDQFTGLTDKNGVEIYEGDVVEYQHSNKSKGRVASAVIFDQCGFTVEVNESILKDDRVLFGCTVIGNIYENPELLK